jgi:hypothetical protein
MKPASHSALPYHRKNPTFDIPDLGAPYPCSHGQCRRQSIGRAFF